MKNIVAFIVLIGIVSAFTFSAGALEYSFDAPEYPYEAKATSVEPVVTSDRGEQPNVDLSKNAAVIPPSFGSKLSYVPDSGTYLTPDLISDRTSAEVSVADYIPADSATFPIPDASDFSYTIPSVGFTAVTDDLYYAGGYLGTLEIPSLKVKVKIYEGTDNATLAKGVGHFEGTSIWDGNCCFASHNRGTSSYFSNIWNLSPGDTVVLTTKLGTRTYAVTSIEKISELDNSMLASSTENCITLFTCVMNERPYRWCVRAELV